MLRHEPARASPAQPVCCHVLAAISPTNCRTPRSPTRPRRGPSLFRSSERWPEV